MLNPYPDELVVGFIARCHTYSSHISFKDTIRDLYGGLEGVRPSLQLPAHLLRLSMFGPSGISADELLIGHTMFPYYKPFLQPEMARRLRDDMLSDRGLGVYLEAGLVPSRVPLQMEMVCCPACIDADIRTYGEPFWHRVHHLPGVRICPIHHVKLYDKCPICNVPLHQGGIQEFPYPVTTCSSGHSLLRCEPCENPFWLRIARDSEFVLSNIPYWYCPAELQSRYLNALYAKGMATPSGSIRQRDLHERFIRHFPQTLWAEIGIEPPISDKEWNWLKELVRKPKRAMHPLFHILLMEFLSGDIPHFTMQARFAPFGCGPWPCLNKAADHYMENVVENLTITLCTDTRQPVGTFRCQCGFVYSRRGPDQSEKDRWRYGRIKELGHVWENKLKDLVKDKPFTLRGLARELGTDPKVISTRLAKLQCSSSNIDHASLSELEKRRARFEGVVRAYPDCSRTQIRRINYRDYSWLYRNDRDWLERILPCPRLSMVRNVHRVNWVQRDLQLSQAVEKAAREIINQPGKPVRVTVSRIGRVCSKKSLLEKCLHKLPITEQTLKSCLESVVQFQMRRIDWAICILIEHGETVAPWKVVRIAGLKPSVEQCVIKYLVKQVDLNSQT